MDCLELYQQAIDDWWEYEDLLGRGMTQGLCCFLLLRHGIEYSQIVWLAVARKVGLKKRIDGYIAEVPCHNYQYDGIPERISTLRWAINNYQYFSRIYALWS